MSFENNSRRLAGFPLGSEGEPRQEPLRGVMVKTSLPPAQCFYTLLEFSASPPLELAPSSATSSLSFPPRQSASKSHNNWDFFGCLKNVLRHGHQWSLEL